MRKPLRPPDNDREVIGLPKRLQEWGKIKMGDKDRSKPKKKKNGDVWYLPTKLDYFVPMLNRRDAEGFFVPDEELCEALGVKIWHNGRVYETDPRLNTIEIYFPYNEPRLIFQSWFAFYDGRSCRCRGNGKVGVFKAGYECPECGSVLTKEGVCEKCGHNYKHCELTNEGFHVQTQCPCRYYENDKCKMNGMLSFNPAVKPQLGMVYTLRTTGFHSISALNTSINGLWNSTNGRLAGIKFNLNLVMHKVENYSPFPVATISYTGGQDKLLDRANQLTHKALAKASYEMGLLKEPPPEETPEQIREITEEFLPDNIDMENDIKPINGTQETLI